MVGAKEQSSPPTAPTATDSLSPPSNRLPAISIYSSVGGNRPDISPHLSFRLGPTKNMQALSLCAVAACCMYMSRRRPNHACAPPTGLWTPIGTLRIRLRVQAAKHRRHPNRRVAPAASHISPTVRDPWCGIPLHAPPPCPADDIVPQQTHVDMANVRTPPQRLHLTSSEY